MPQMTVIKKAEQMLDFKSCFIAQKTRQRLERAEKEGDSPRKIKRHKTKYDSYRCVVDGIRDSMMYNV